MAANPFTRGTCPGRARPPHQGSFRRGHAKRGGRKAGTPNAISPRARKAIAAAVAAAARRIARGTNRSRRHWRRIILNNPLINEARERQGQFTLTGAPRLRSRSFNMKTFCRDLSAVAVRAIKTDQFVDRDLVECLELLAVHDPSEFAKFLSIAAPKQSYRAGPTPRRLSGARPSIRARTAARPRRTPSRRAPARRSRRQQSAPPTAPVAIAITGSGGSKKPADQ